MNDEKYKEEQVKLEREKFKYMKQKDEKEFEIKKKESKIKRFDLLVSFCSVLIALLSLLFAYMKDREVNALQKKQEGIERLSQKMIIAFSSSDKLTHNHRVEIISNGATEEYNIQIPDTSYSVISGFPKSTFVAQIFNGENISKVRTLDTGDFYQYFKKDDSSDNYLINVGIEPLLVPAIRKSETGITYVTYFFVNIVDFLDNNNFYIVKYEFEKENGNLICRQCDVITEKNIGIISESIIREDFNEFIRILNYSRQCR